MKLTIPFAPDMDITIFDSRINDYREKELAYSYNTKQHNDMWSEISGKWYSGAPGYPEYNCKLLHKIWDIFDHGTEEDLIMLKLSLPTHV